MHLRGGLAVPTACALLALSLVTMSGCAGGEETSTGAPSFDSGGGGDTGGGAEASVDGGGDLDTGGTEDTGSAGDTGGTGDTGASDVGADTGGGAAGKTVTALVSGGTTMQSTSYKLVTTTGQVPGSTTSSSGKYQLKGGVVGVSQP